MKYQYRVETQINFAKIEGLQRKALEMTLNAIGLKAVDIWRNIIKVKKVIDKGTFRDSVTFRVFTKDRSVEIGTPIQDPPYPIYLELGTSKMRARPTLKPAIVDYREVYQDLARQIYENM